MIVKSRVGGFHERQLTFQLTSIKMPVRNKFHTLYENSKKAEWQTVLSSYFAQRWNLIKDPGYKCPVASRFGIGSNPGRQISVAIVVSNELTTFLGKEEIENNAYIIIFTFLSI